VLKKSSSYNSSAIEEGKASAMILKSPKSLGKSKLNKDNNNN
jgi:hypothetical protein